MPIEFRRRGTERTREAINRLLAVGHRDAQGRRKRQDLDEWEGAYQQPVLNRSRGDQSVRVAGWREWPALGPIGHQLDPNHEALTAYISDVAMAPDPLP
jgi:hypothetical protein